MALRSEIPGDNLIHAVVAIIQRANTFLFVKRSDYIEAASGYWCPVSGRIEKNETQQAALKREVMEEVGVDAVAVRKICEIPSSDGQFLLYYWQTKITEGVAQICSHEATEMAWFTLEELKQLQPTFEEDVRIVEEFANLYRI